MNSSYDDLIKMGFDCLKCFNTVEEEFDLICKDSILNYIHYAEQSELEKRKKCSTFNHRKKNCCFVTDCM